MQTSIALKDIVLVGGGHSHALLIRQWGMKPLPGVRITLVSLDALTPYSGMLPGLVAGHYDFDEVHIDLTRLCAWAGVRFIEAKMTAIDLAKRELSLLSRPALGFDLLSLDTGSTPSLGVPGAAEHSVPVKPVHTFHDRWLDILDRVRENAATATSVITHGVESGSGTGSDVDASVSSSRAEGVSESTSDHRLQLGVVGSGAGGYELVAAMRHALPAAAAELHWFLRGELPLSGRPERVGRQVRHAAQEAGIVIHDGFDVAEVLADGVRAADGRFVPLGETLWCTGATGPSWPRDAGLAVDEQGFVATNEYLQSTSHPFVFATGDVGTQVGSPSTKAGVFAVRQAPILFDNLQHILLHRPLRRYRPQKDFLSLMATGPRQAIASRGAFVAQSGLIWQWKNRIDQRFMQRFRELPPMAATRSMTKSAPWSALRSTLWSAVKPTPGIPRRLLIDTQIDGELLEPEAMRCSGCGAKIGADILYRVLSRLALPGRAGLVRGLPGQGVETDCNPGGGPDAAILDPGGQLLVQSVDQLRALVDDPYVFGRIAACHAISDVVTERAEPQSAQVLATLPLAAEALVERDLYQLMAGAVSVLDAAGCALAGGHSAEGTDLQLGFVINALLDRGVSGATPMQTGDSLVLTQPLGVGILFAGLMQGRAAGRDLKEALHDMQQLNLAASRCLYDAGASAMTDITGFGLLGHLDNLLQGTGMHARVVTADVPLFAGVAELAAAGVHSTLWRQNRSVLTRYAGAAGLSPAWQRILVDPQTSGGLLAVVPPARLATCLEALQGLGYRQPCRIGSLTQHCEHQIDSGLTRSTASLGSISTHRRISR